ncbi:MAG: NUDIX domain-containing protein [Chloroflexota bacterium]|nr:NUDIX domain-containing protein [Chloroflexota bacterium]
MSSISQEGEASGRVTNPHPDRVEVVSTERAFDGFFRIDRVRFRHARYDGGMSDEITRLVFERGDSVAVLPYNRKRSEVVLVKQFRYPAHVRGGPGWLWEIIAGVQEEGLAPKEVARKEALEEAGYQLGDLEKIMTVYPSPGACSERIHIYLAPFEQTDRVAEGGGIESEDILVRTFSLDEARRMMEDGDIVDAKTTLALQYLILHWDDE